MFKRLMSKVTAALAPIAMALSPVTATAETVAHTPIASSAVSEAVSAERAALRSQVDRILGEAGSRMHGRPGRIAKFFGAVDPLEGRQGKEFAARVKATQDKFKDGWML